MRSRRRCFASPDWTEALGWLSDRMDRRHVIIGASAMAAAIRRANAKDLRRLKEILEAERVDR